MTGLKRHVMYDSTYMTFTVCKKEICRVDRGD